MNPKTLSVITILSARKKRNFINEGTICREALEVFCLAQTSCRLEGL